MKFTNRDDTNAVTIDGSEAITLIGAAEGPLPVLRQKNSFLHVDVTSLDDTAAAALDIIAKECEHYIKENHPEADTVMPYTYEVATPEGPRRVMRVVLNKESKSWKDHEQASGCTEETWEGRTCAAMVRATGLVLTPSGAFINFTATDILPLP